MKAIHHLSREEAWKLLSKKFPDPWKVTAHEYLNFLYANGLEVCKEESIIKAFNLRSK